MKCKKYFIIACIPLALSLIVLAIGLVDKANTGAFNQRIFEVLDKYGAEFPMPSAEIDELDRLLSRPRPNPISRVVIEYWGAVDSPDAHSITQAAYTYETPYESAGKLTIHGDTRPWYLECSNRYPSDFVFKRFATAALVLFVISIGLLCLWRYKARGEGK